jgi:endonuclease/exonuclease/phosphatase family metal-dependent hydrolase
MTAEVTPGWAGESGGEEARHAVAAGAHTFHTGLMWRPDAGIEPVPASFQAWGAGTFFHALALLTLRLDGTAVGFGSYHAPPFGRHERADQAARVLAAVTRPPQPMLLGGDMNTVSAARLPGPDGTPVWYDPDPYQSGWFGDLVYQCDWRYESDGSRVWWADRRPSDVLISGGLHDAAATVRAPWQATTGHHPADAFGQRAHRRIDQVYASDDMRDRLVGHEVIDTPLARQASDHLPVVVSFTA